jgi:hypothetical protein
MEGRGHRRRDLRPFDPDYGSTFTAGIAPSCAPSRSSRTCRPKSKSLFNLTETYGKLTSAGHSADRTAHTRHRHQDQHLRRRLRAGRVLLAPTSTGLPHVNFNHDYSQGLDLQQVYGGGIGWTVIQQPKQQLDLKADVHYEKQAFQVASSNQNLIGSTISEIYHRNLPKGIVFTENADALPAYNNSNAYSADATAGIVLPVYKRLGANFTTTDNFLNNPAPGFKKNSFQFVMGVTYTLP